MRSTVLALLLFPVTALAQSTTPAPELAPPPGARVIQLTSKPGDFTEPSIAINPRDPRQLVGAFQVNASVAYSQDAGQTWALAEGTAATDYKVSGDVSVTYDHQGRAFLCYIAFDKLATENYWAHGATRNGIFVRRSLDGGRTWEKDARTVIAHPSNPGIPFEDKPYIVADTTHSKYAGNLYIGWTEFTLTKTILLFSRSTDAGVTWSQPIEISTREGLPRDDNGAVEGFAGAVAEDGTLYVVWCDITGLVLAISRDGGRSFSRSRTVIKAGPSYFDPTSVGRGNGFPQIAIDPRANTVVVAWSDFTNGDIDVFSAISRDRSKHWTTPQRVNDDAPHNGRDQFFQWLAVDPTDGSQNIIFCDRRADPANRSYYITLARSTDGGITFKNYVWSTHPSDPKDIFMGDYMGIAAYGGKVYGIWARTVMQEEQAAVAARAPEPPPASDSAAPADGEKPAASPDVEKTALSLKPKGLLVEVGLADFSGK